MTTEKRADLSGVVATVLVVLTVAIVAAVFFSNPDWAVFSSATPITGRTDDAAKGENMTTVHSLVEKISEAEFRDQVLNSATPVLVDFYADWCHPCRQLAPVLDQFAAETSGVRIVKINVDENQDLAARYQVNSIPALIVFKNGQVIAHHAGLAGKEQLSALLGS